MRQFLKNFRLRDPGPSEQDLETWLRHVNTGEAFNNAVMNASMSAYFAGAIRELEMQPIDLCVGEGHDFNYIVPGRLPEGDVENAIYTSIHYWSEPKREAKEHALNLLALLTLAIRNQTFEEGVSITDVDHVQGQEGRLALT